MARIRSGGKESYSAWLLQKSVNLQGASMDPMSSSLVLKRFEYDPFTYVGEYSIWFSHPYVEFDFDVLAREDRVELLERGFFGDKSEELYMRQHVYQMLQDEFSKSGNVRICQRQDLHRGE